MLIKYIKLENFRQFTGKQTIEFSTDPDKKATLVIAKNATGKTTLLEAFKWAFYGTTDLKSIVNNELNSTMDYGTNLQIVVSVCIEHAGKDALIVRKAIATKKTSRSQITSTTLFIEFKDEKGITKHLNNKDAQLYINDVVPENLFEYFFFQGENIEKFGSIISASGASGSKELVRAIQSMLGFNWLYQERDDLQRLRKEYAIEIENNNNDETLQNIQKGINECTSTIENAELDLDKVKKELETYNKEHKLLENEILQMGDVSAKQAQTIKLGIEIKKKDESIKAEKRALFKNFSNRSFAYFALKLISETVEELKNQGNLDKGVPSLSVPGVKYILERKKCICGQTFEVGDEHYNALVELMKYIPPNDLGTQLKEFSKLADVYKNLGETYYDDFIAASASLINDQTYYDEKVSEKEKIDKEIEAYPDVTKKKQHEKELAEKINSLNREQWENENILSSAKTDLDKYMKQKSNYDVTDKQTRVLEECDWQVNKLITRISNYCERKEEEKRKELEDAINNIFLSVFNIHIKFTLTSDYGIVPQAENEDDLYDFQNSTSQDAIMAFAFIGGIIQLARNKTKKITLNDETEIEDEGVDMEPYPLVMDAPSSSFDTDRIRSFCEIMPNIAEQVIFLIKDTDGYYVRDNLSKIIGKEYTMTKIDNFNTEITEDKK